LYSKRQLQEKISASVPRQNKIYLLNTAQNWLVIHSFGSLSNSSLDPKVFIGRDTVVVSSPDSQSGGTGSTPGGALNARGSPSLLSFYGLPIRTGFDWVNGFAPLSRSSLVELWRVMNACHVLVEISLIIT